MRHAKKSFANTKSSSLLDADIPDILPILVVGAQCQSKAVMLARMNNYSDHYNGNSLPTSQKNNFFHGCSKCISDLLPRSESPQTFLNNGSDKLLATIMYIFLNYKSEDYLEFVDSLWFSVLSLFDH